MVFRTVSAPPGSGGADTSAPLPPEEAEETSEEEIEEAEEAAEEETEEAEEDLVAPGAEEGKAVPGTGFRQAVNSPRHVRTASASAEAWNFFMAILNPSDGYFRQTKNLPPQSMGTKGKPSAVPPAFAHTRALKSPVTAENPSPSQRPLPGEPSGPCSKAAYSRRPPLSGECFPLFSRSTHFFLPPKAALFVLIPQIFL